MPTSPHNDVEVSPAASGPAAAPAHFGNVRDEFRALTSTCGVYDLSSRAKIKLTGSDRVRWLNGMVTNNIRDLAIGHGVYAFLLNPQGHILGDLFAYNLGDQIIVDTEQSQLAKILAAFDHYIIMDDVEVSNVSESQVAVGLAGPKSKQVLASAGFEIPELQPLQLADLVWRGAQAHVVGGESDYQSFGTWIAPEHAAEVRAALVGAGATPVGTDALELYRVALGVPRYGQDIRERDLPQETEQQRALNFNKGCYIGQEIVERIRSRGNVHRKFTGFRTAGPPPPIGAKLQLQDKDIGEITSSAVIPAASGDQTVGLGYIRREVGAPGKEVQAAGSTAIVTDLPFTALLT